MPLIDKNHPLQARVHCYNEEGLFMDNVAAVDTDEGWMELMVTYPPYYGDRRRVIIDRRTQEVVKLRVYAGFFIHDRESHKLLYSVCWDSENGGVGKLVALDWTNI